MRSKSIPNPTRLLLSHNVLKAFHQCHVVTLVLGLSSPFCVSLSRLSVGRNWATSGILTHTCTLEWGSWTNSLTNRAKLWHWPSLTVTTTAGWPKWVAYLNSSQRACTGQQQTITAIKLIVTVAMLCNKFRNDSRALSLFWWLNLQNPTAAKEMFYQQQHYSNLTAHQPCLYMFDFLPVLQSVCFCVCFVCPSKLCESALLHSRLCLHLPHFATWAGQQHIRPSERLWP